MARSVSQMRNTAARPSRAAWEIDSVYLDCRQRPMCARFWSIHVDFGTSIFFCMSMMIAWMFTIH